MDKAKSQKSNDELLRAIATIKGARPEELIRVAVTLATLEMHQRLGSNHLLDAYERAAVMVVAGHIDALRNKLAGLDQLEAMDCSKMSIN